MNRPDEPQHHLNLWKRQLGEVPDYVWHQRLDDKGCVVYRRGFPSRRGDIA